ncbi:hypothetical protein LY78DRAFT_652843 [Colletotrichum sublineola]|nr:hypothetical protein LY78DRAFT_652843 [Colletotrichum sublineola]
MPSSRLLSSVANCRWGVLCGFFPRQVPHCLAWLLHPLISFFACFVIECGIEPKGGPMRQGVAFPDFSPTSRREHDSLGGVWATPGVVRFA